ncbi:hypothetical protein Aca07nite_59860 [Actinoplanes capillaceus]|uniref:Uncharacterized protein n=1 Tax=Actinoplanes campanulatus TaxID=113559 RepID=A0ABQ3WQY7_9ACTN|nr:hypothetical protein [Actinoplanes capillaceus]GID48711.1 hypothetical protein Aca07nite_59860 [Actinoplanes capillaceus]
MRLDRPAPLEDPARHLDPSAIRPWPGLLSIDAGDEWAVSSIRRLTAPMRTSVRALLDEESFTLLRAVVPDRALDPADSPGQPVAQRLRQRFGGGPPADEGEPCRIGSLPGRCDRFHDRTGAPRGFLLSTDTGEADRAGSPLGLVVSATGPPSRHDTVASTGWRLATTAVPGAPAHHWVRVSGWQWAETLRLDTCDRTVTATAERTWARDLRQWTDDVFARGPLLRGMRMLGDRPVHVEGLPGARMLRFDWQPSGMDRLLTTVVLGVRAGVGFQLVMELSLHSDAALSATLDDLLPSVRLA